METNQKITKSREDYRPVAVRGAVIYFLIQEMSLVNTMYQVSLNQFLGKFFEAIEVAPKDNFPKKRIENIIETLTHICWAYIVRGLYEKDKLLFCLQLALKIDMSLPAEKNPIDFNDYQTFIKAGAALPPGASGNTDEHLPEQFEAIRDNVIALSQLNSLRGLITHITGSTQEWSRLLSSQTPEEDPLPNFGQTKPEDVKPFTKALIIRCLRPDRAIFAAKNYIAEFLGPQFNEYPNVSLDAIAQEAGNASPVIFLLSPGSDPTPLIEEAAKRAKKEEPIVTPTIEKTTLGDLDALAALKSQMDAEAAAEKKAKKAPAKKAEPKAETKKAEEAKAEEQPKAEAPKAEEAAETEEKA